MRILQIAKKFPWPVKDGEAIAVLNLTRGFAKLGHEVTVLALNTKKHYFDPSKLPAAIAELAQFVAVDIDTTVKVKDAFLNIFTSKSYNVERFWSDIFAKRLEGLLTQKDYDLVIMEGGYLMQYAHLVKQHSKAKIVFRPHNLEYIIWERLAETEKGVLLPWYYGLLARRMRAYEVSIMNEANFLAPVSANNRDMFVKLGCTLPAMVIPIGYSFDELPKISDVEENAILFLGGMDWIPNREGVEWFIDSVWPLIKAAKPGAKFYLAGRNFPEKMLQLNIDGIKVLGEVDDAKALLVSVAICIVPLMAGSGMRVKIIEAMALGRAIVSTTVGAEGVDYTDGKDILIADEPKHFAQALLTVLNDSEKRRELGINAQQLVKDKYDNLQLCRALIDFCHS